MFIAFFLIIFAAHFFLDLHRFFHPISLKLHQSCLLLAPESLWQEAYQGIVCGKNLRPTAFKEALQTTGLIHLIVVSGTHLNLLNGVLKKNKWSRLFALPLLFLYCGVCKLEPPVVRAFLSLLLSHINQQWKLFIPSLKLVHYSGLLSLALFPEWFFSNSLVLSWLAALALQVSKNPFVSSSLCYVLLLPILGSFSFLSPWTILINALLANFIGFFLFPLSLFSFFLPSLHYFSDKIWKLLQNLIEILQANLQVTTQLFATPLPVSLTWFFVMSLSALLQLKRKIQ